MANEHNTILSVSMDPKGLLDNLCYISDKEGECGVGSGSSSSDLTPQTTFPKYSPERREDNYPPQNYRRPSMLKIPYRIAVTVESGYKRFGELNALDGVNMSVQEGTIYGLLGSSGCGKTTLLSCLVGLRRLDCGSILICGKHPGSRGSGVPGRLVGYMPQDIALNGEFTIVEVCHFFGRLYGMTKERVDGRVDHLINILDLKQCKTLIKNMSGGQKRRASFLVALLHEPEILILDEPTVGVDPVLRSNIWNHLRELVDNVGTTVIITTHYIEEMRQADTVGIMRNGILMTEGSPQQLMNAHDASMLEDVVLYYCLKTEDPFGEAGPASVLRRRASKIQIEEMDIHFNGNGNVENGVERRTRPAKAPYMDNHASDGIQTHTFNRIKALTLKNMMVIIRSVGFLLFIFICPAAVVSIYSYAIGSTPTQLSLGVVIDQHTCQLNHPLNIICGSSDLTCHFLNAMEATGAFSLTLFDSDEEALDDVHSSRIWGYVHLGSNFSQYIYYRTVEADNSIETVEGAKISVHLDMSTVTTGQIIQKLIFDAYRNFSISLLLSCKVDITGRDLPITIERPIYGDAGNLKFRNYLAPGMTIGFISFLSTLTCGLAYIVEKKDGMITRTKVSGVTTLEIMISHFLPQFLIMMVQNGSALIILFTLFDIPEVGSIWLAYSVILWYGISGIGLGFVAATLFDDEKNAMLCAVGIMLPNFILSGVIFPLESMPPLLRKIAVVIPGTYPSESLRSILLRGWGMSHFAVYMGFASPVLWSILYAIITFLVLQIRN